MRRLTSSALVIITVALLSACTTWSRVDTPFVKAPDNSFTVPLPLGWVRADIVKDRIVVTRDGPGLQIIEARHLAHDKAFPETDRTSSPTMLPTELAELTLAEIRTSEDLSGLEVVENRPAEIAGHSGFRLLIRFRNPRGLAYQRDIAGVASDAGLFLFIYQAPLLHYFPQNRADFDALLAGVQIHQ